MPTFSLSLTQYQYVLYLWLSAHLPTSVYYSVDLFTYTAGFGTPIPFSWFGAHLVGFSQEVLALKQIFNIFR